MKLPSNLTNRLKTLRGKQSQKKFAEELGVPFWSYCRYETGERPMPINVLLKISHLSKKSVNWILTGNKIKDDDDALILPDSLRTAALNYFHFQCISCRFNVENESFFIIKEFPKTEEKPRIAGLICLCPNCNKLLDLGLIPYETMKAYKGIFKQYKKRLDSMLKKA